MTETELGISKLANGVMMAFWKEDRSGKLLYLFIAKLCGLTRLAAFCIEDKYKPYIVTKDEYKRIKEERRKDMKWCDICHRNELTGEWKSCDSSCPVFGKDFEELAKIVIENNNKEDKDIKEDF